MLVILVIFVRAFLDNGCGSKLIEIEDFLDISSCSILKKIALLRELCSTILSLSSKIRGICYFESKLALLDISSFEWILWNINRSTHLYFLSLKIASRYSRYSHHLNSLKRNRKLDVFYSHLNYFFIKIRITRELFVSRRDKRLELNRSRLKIVLYFNFEKENTFHNRTIIHLYPDSTFRSSFQINEFPEKIPFRN